MKTIYDLQETMKKVENQYQTLLGIYRDEIKENGEPCSNTIELFNALSFSISKACDLLDKGLEGDFPW